VDNNLAEVTSSGRSFQVRGPTTGNCRHCQKYCYLQAICSFI